MEGKPVDGEHPNEAANKIESLEMEKNKMHAEFNIQRAKMKDLYLQKEAECKRLTSEIESLNNELSEIKSQLLIAEYRTENEMQTQERKAQEEITSLQQLVQETIEESAIRKLELERIKQENRELKELIVSHQQQETPSLAPVLSHVKKTLARKLGADSSGNFDSLDDSMRKVNKYAQEDAEVLRSLVVPLEEEIKALKEKLRSADEELQTYRNLSNNNVSNETNLVDEAKKAVTSFGQHQKQNVQDQKIYTNFELVNKSTSMEYLKCEMCQNYETKLVQAQKLLTENQQTLEQLQKMMYDAREELNKEAALRRDLEEQWQEKREEHKEQIQNLTEQVKKSEKELIKLQQHFLDTKDEINRQLNRLTSDRQHINTHLERLQSDNDFLSGKYLATSEELQNQRIDLPNNVEDLHELLLKQHDELIQARVGREFEQRKCLSYMDEAQILREKLEFVTKEKEERERKHQLQIKSLEERLKAVLLSQQNARSLKEQHEKREMELNRQSSEMRMQIIELRAANEAVERTNNEMKGKIKILQEELATSEHVQKDFVKLSQSLQMNLEKIRQAETQVRWQDDEDVDKCPNCNVLFTVTCRKQHCRHCGGIYCEKCLTKSVPSGPRKKAARVCDICHTLLIPDTAPYFSQAPPQSPT